jgi:hypothetical protein
VARIVVCVAIGACANCDRGQNPSQSAPAPTDPLVKAVPPTPIAEEKADLDEPGWDPGWTQLVEKSLPPELLSRDRERAVKSLCPRFKDLSDAEKRVYWAYFFQALAGAEAGLKPTADVHHTDPEVDVVDSVAHRMVRQEGLLQLTYMDSERYGCDFDWEKDKDLDEHDPAKTILRPENNLLCGIKILSNQLITRRKRLLSASSYWVTLQPGRPSFEVFIKQMANEPAFCGRGHVRGYQPEASVTAPQTDAKTNASVAPSR